VIQRGFQGFHQETGRQGVSLRLWQPAQMPDIFATCGFGELQQQRSPAV